MYVCVYIYERIPENGVLLLCVRFSLKTLCPQQTSPGVPTTHPTSVTHFSFYVYTTTLSFAVRPLQMLSMSLLNLLISSFFNSLLEIIFCMNTAANWFR